MLWRLYKRFCVSLNKLALQLISASIISCILFFLGIDGTISLSYLFNALDHCLLKWSMEINDKKRVISHRQLELYFQQILQVAINKSLFFRRLGKYEAGYTILKSTEKIYWEMNVSLNPKSQQICSQYKTVMGIILFEAGLLDESVLEFMFALKTLRREHMNLCKNFQCLRFENMNPNEAVLIEKNVIIYWIIISSYLES